jgi:hypothetical protein
VALGGAREQVADAPPRCTAWWGVLPRARCVPRGAGGRQSEALPERVGRDGRRQCSGGCRRRQRPGCR